MNVFRHSMNCSSSKDNFFFQLIPTTDLGLFEIFMKSILKELKFN